MSFLTDKTKNLLKLGETIKTKTHDYSILAKLMLDIKKDENELEKNLTEIGTHVIEKRRKGEKTLNLDDKNIVIYADKIKEVEKSIEKKRVEIEELKKKSHDDHGGKPEEIKQD